MRFSLDNMVASPIPMSQPRPRICLPSDDDITTPDSIAHSTKRSVERREMTSVTTRSRKPPTMSIAYSSPSSPMGPGIAGGLARNSSIDYGSPVLSPPQPLKRSRPSLFPGGSSRRSLSQSQRKSSSTTVAAPRPQPLASDNESLSLSFASDSQANQINVSTQETLPSVDLSQWRYPKSIVPPKTLLQDLVDQASEQDSSDQATLKAGGIMSFEEVLLPALAIQEEAALKKLQAKVQRDTPDLSVAVETCRKVVRRSLMEAINEVQRQRQIRLERQAQHRVAARQAKRAQLEALQQSLQEKREKCKAEALQWVQTQQESDRRTQTRNLPKNKALWKEIVVLTRSKTQLEKEERMWNHTKQVLLRENQQRDRELQEAKESTDADSSSSPAIQAAKDPLQTKTESTVQDMVLASKRIQEGLSVVLQILQDSEQARKDLYQQYRSKHQFQGYQGVRNPRNLIRFLSQD